MLNRHHRKARALFGLSDVVCTALAFEAAYQTRRYLQLERYFEIPSKALVLGFAILAWVYIGRWLEVYDRLDAGKTTVTLRDTARQCFYGSIALILFEYSLRMDLSRVFLALFTGYSFITLLTFRLAARNVVAWIRREYGAPHHVVIIGSGERAARLAAELARHPDTGVQVDAILPVDRLRGELAAMLRRQVIDEILFAVGTESLGELEDIFLLCDEEGVRTRLLLDFFPHVNSQVTLDRFGVTPLLTFTAAPQDEIHLLIKRTIDLAVASIALAVLFPLMLVIAAAIRWSSPGPAIFSQIRCGLNGRRFRFYKFRSMCADADARRAEVAHLSRRDLAMKIPNDPRVTPLGRWLRKFSVDEWPQLWNVIKGDMSLVGPRPAIPEEVDRYQQWQRRRLRMRPGLTCLWAIEGRDSVDFETWMKMDLQYIDSWSLSLDSKILLLTIPRVLTGSGAS